MEKKIKIFKIGSCRSSINEYVLPDIDIFYNYDFCHSTKEVLQYIDFMEGKKKLNKNKEMQCIMDNPEAYDAKYYKKYYDEADIIYIEVSSIKIFEYDSYYYSQTRYRSFTENSNNVELDTICYSMTLEQLENDIEEIKKRINKPVIFQGHYDVSRLVDKNFNKKLIETRKLIDNALLNSADYKIILKNILKSPSIMLSKYNESDFNHFSEIGYKTIGEEFNKIVKKILKY